MAPSVCDSLALSTKVNDLSSPYRGITRLIGRTYHSADRLNASARGLTDRIAILDTRGSGPLESRLQWMMTENFSGINGDGTLNLHGFDIRPDPKSDHLRILLINHRSPIDPITGASIYAASVGANSTIELFYTEVGSGNMRHVRTYADPAIQTPNQVAWVNDDAFLFTNDHSAKVGFVSPIGQCMILQQTTKQYPSVDISTFSLVEEVSGIVTLV